MVFNVVILSPHGYFAQANVLGYPDTGGQVVYILDQVRAMENEMLLRIKQQGLNITPRILIVTRLLPDEHGTTCGQRLEKVLGTEHVCHSEQKMGLFTNGSRDSKSGLTWKHTPMTWHTRLPESCRPTLT